MARTPTSSASRCRRASTSGARASAAPAGSATSGSDAKCLGTGSGSGGPPPPPDGDTICQQQLEAAGGTGTIACNLFVANPAGSGSQSVDWACGILCGSDGSGGDFGTCPTGLDCTQNFCR